MGMAFIDLHLEPPLAEAKQILEMAASLGWNDVCFIRPYSKADRASLEDFRNFRKALDGFNSKVHIHCGVRLNPSKGMVQSVVRAFRVDANVVFAGGSAEINKEAADCWEVDVISSPHLSAEKDFMHQRWSGIDKSIATACADKGIAIEVCFSDLLRTYGKQRNTIFARIKQNLQICNDAGAPVLLTSGAMSPYEMRAPLDMCAILTALGAPDSVSRASVSSVPSGILERDARRKNPNVIIKGLEVVDWGREKPKQKRIYGWY